MEHLQQFGLAQDPFSNEPDLRYYFDSACHKDALLRVERGLRQNKGLTVLTGEPGTGKTLLTRRLYESLEEEIFELSLMVILPGAADAQSVLSRFARQLGIEEPAADRSALLAQLYERLAIVREDGRHAVLIIDDAHVLEPEGMAEIAGLLNMEYEDRRLLSLLLVGPPDLDNFLSGNSALLQRVDVRVRLQPLDLHDTAAYVAHRLTVVGGQLDAIPPATLEALFKFSRGRPRLINTLGDNALFEAYLGSRQQVEPSDVERAAGDLGIGPDPGTTYNPVGRASAQRSQPPSFDPIANAVVRSAAPRSSSGSTSGNLRRAPMASVMGEITDPDSGPAFEASVRGHSSSARDGDADLDALLDDGGEGDELTTLLSADFQLAGDTGDLDAEVEAILSEQDSEPAVNPLPAFSARNTASPRLAEATRIALAEEEDLVTGSIEELDDLFVELIED